MFRGVSNGPTFTKPISEAQAEIVHRIWAEERHRQDVLRRADKGAFATAVRAGATFVGSLLDPFVLVPVLLAGLVLRTPRKLSWALGGIVAAVTGLGAGLASQWNADMAELGVLGMDRFYINPARLFDQLLGPSLWASRSSPSAGPPVCRKVRKLPMRKTTIAAVWKPVTGGAN